MKTVLASLVLAGALFAPASGQDDKPINQSCIMMKGKPLKAGVVSKYEGFTFGFC